MHIDRTGTKGNQDTREKEDIIFSFIFALGSAHMDFSLGGVEIGDWRWPHLEWVTDARFLDYIFCFCLKKKGISV